MNRRFLYLIAFALIMVIFFVYTNNEEEVKDNEQIIIIEKETIMDDFLVKYYEGKRFPNNTNHFYLKGINFPDSFKGIAGEVFYLSYEDGEKSFTIKYLLKEDAKKTRLIYEEREIWENFIPPANNFETYYVKQGEWVRLEK